METLTSLFPVTVAAAVLLFFVKEILEFFRRRNAEFRKKEAIRILLARECELNNATVKRLGFILQTIKNEQEADRDTKFTIVFTKAGQIRFHYDNREGGGSMPITGPHSVVLERQLLEIAAIDKDLYVLAEAAYAVVSELAHIRQNLIDAIAPERVNEDVDPFDMLFPHALDRLPVAYKALSALYVECTGSVLETVRWR